MGSVSYDFLADSIFFHPDSIENEFKSETPERLEKDLYAYRQHIIDNYEVLVKEIRGRDSSLKVLSSRGNVPLSLLKQTALYVDQFIISDPIFSFTDLGKNNAKLMSKHLGYEENTLDRAAIAKASRFLKDIVPMVAGNYIKLFPVSYYFEGPKEIPLKYSENLFSDLLPAETQQGLNVVLAVGGLIASVQTSGWSLAATALAAGKGYKEYKEYKEKIRENPAYLLWQVRK